MGSTRDIKKRINNVASVEQIIRAMNMVASTGLVKVRAQLEGVRPIYKELQRIVREVSLEEDAKSHIFYREREIKNSLYIILTSDRGFSGGYNSNINKKAMEHISQGKNEKLVIAGSKGYDYFKKNNKNIIHAIVDVSDSKVYYGAENLAEKTRDLYVSGEVDEVFIAYTHFENVLTHVPMVEKLLPIKIEEDNNKNTYYKSYASYKKDASYKIDNIYKKYEPDLDTFINKMVPLYLHMNIFRAFSESHTSEQAARMVNMDSAGKNANEIIEDLNREYNRKRQAAITQEINEIVGSATALSKGGKDDR